MSGFVWVFLEEISTWLSWIERCIFTSVSVIRCTGSEMEQKDKGRVNFLFSWAGGFVFFWPWTSELLVLQSFDSGTYLWTPGSQTFDTGVGLLFTLLLPNLFVAKIVLFPVSLSYRVLIGKNHLPSLASWGC